MQRAYNEDIDEPVASAHYWVDGERVHWKELTDVRSPTVDELRLERRFERAQAAGDEEAMDRLVDEGLELKRQREIYEGLRG